MSNRWCLGPNASQHQGWLSRYQGTIRRFTLYAVLASKCQPNLLKTPHLSSRSHQLRAELAELPFHSKMSWKGSVVQVKNAGTKTLRSLFIIWIEPWCRIAICLAQMLLANMIACISVCLYQRSGRSLANLSQRDALQILAASQCPITMQIKSQRMGDDGASWEPLPLNLQHLNLPLPMMKAGLNTAAYQDR